MYSTIRSKPIKSTDFSYTATFHNGIQLLICNIVSMLFSKPHSSLFSFSLLFKPLKPIQTKAESKRLKQSERWDGFFCYLCTLGSIRASLPPYEGLRNNIREGP